MEKKIFVTKPALPELENYVEYLKDIWESKWLTNGGVQQQNLEQELLNYLDVPFLSLFNNGTIALIVACQSFRLSGEVITTPFTFAATPHVLAWNDIKPIFCDIEPNTYNIDVDKIESSITPKTTAILPVHVFGVPCDVEAIQSIADRYGLRVIYDAAHAFGTEIDGKSIGSFGDITMFSFHATKLFHTAEGGALAFKDQRLKQRIDYLKNFGIKNEEEVVMPGINGKMNELQAALGRAMLKIIDEERAGRTRIERIYRENLYKVKGIHLPHIMTNITRPSLQYFVIRVDERLYGRTRNELHIFLREKNIITRKYFYPLCSDYPCFHQLPSSSAANLPVAQQVVKEVLCLPFYGTLEDKEAIEICETIASFRRG